MSWDIKEQSDWNPFTINQWIAWICSTVVAAITMMIFLYSNFQTKDDADNNNQETTSRLDRIENKVDQILLRK